MSIARARLELRDTGGRRHRSPGRPVIRPIPHSDPGRGRDGLDPILEAAAELFDSRGYDRPSVSDVTDRAGVGRRTISGRYGGKPELLAAIVNEFCRGFLRYAMAWHGVEPGEPASAGEDRSTDLEWLVGAMRAYVAQRGSLARVALAARQLPWLARATAAARADLDRFLGFLLGTGPRSRPASCLVMELLACVAREETGGGNRLEADWPRLAVLLPQVAAALAPRVADEE